LWIKGEFLQASRFIENSTLGVRRKVGGMS
jgi:hypothetical protein